MFDCSLFYDMATAEKVVDYLFKNKEFLIVECINTIEFLNKRELISEDDNICLIEINSECKTQRNNQKSKTKEIIINDKDCGDSLGIKVSTVLDFFRNHGVPLEELLDFTADRD